MGTGIAQVCAAKGYEISLYDIEISRVEKARASIAKRLDGSVQKGKLTREERDATIGRINPCASLSCATGCDLVIEAAVENLEIKLSIFKELNSICTPGTLLATNTSSISITAIAAVLDHPENFIGLHFFNPVHAMKLLEIIPGLCTSSETLSAARAFGESIDKIIIVAKDSPAFLVNRMLNMLLNEAAFRDQGNGSVADIDSGMLYGCGHPMGPLTLIDLVGVDVMLAVMETLYFELKDSKYRPAPILKKMVRAGYLGQKAGKGFYLYDEKGGKLPNPVFKTLK